MIFIIPIILGAAALVTAGVGVSAGANGVSKLQKAEKIGKSAEQRYKKANKSLEKSFKLPKNLRKNTVNCKLMSKSTPSADLLSLLAELIKE
ncbi:hypothetical protein MICAER10613_003120 [Microcystis aeruginosa]